MTEPDQRKAAVLRPSEIKTHDRGGGGTNIGNEAASRAAPDGYTFLLGHSRCR
jgi:hypothetical protein